MSKFVARLGMVLLLAVTTSTLSSCRADSGPPQTQSIYPLATWYPDPKAQMLAVAAERGDAEAVRRLMKDEGVDPDKIFSQGAEPGRPLLVWPILNNSPAGLKAMLENGADPNAAVLHPAQDDERFKGRHINNAMVFAAKADDPVYLKLLLDHGGDPNTRNSNGETLMYQALIMGEGWEKVKLLVERGADVNTPDAGGGQPIIEEYTDFADFQQVYWLLEHGADPTLQYIGDAAPQPVIHREDSHVINAIFWYPVRSGYSVWQQKCQAWLLKRGFKRPPMWEYLRKMREKFNVTTDPAQVPLPDLKVLDQEVAP